MNKTNFTKKIVAAACLFSMGLSVCAENIYPYENKQPQNINGTVQQVGINDIIIIKKDNSSSIFNSLGILGPSGNTSPTEKIFAGLLPVVIVGSIVFDPYVIPIDGKYYVMVKDKTEGTWGPEDLLGYTDPKNDKFRSLRALESDKKYAKLTGEEIQKAGVRLVQLNKDGVLLVKERDKDYDLAKINYIDMLNLKVTANGESTGIFGHFNVHLKNTNPKMVTGFVTYDTESKLKILFE